MVDSRVDFGGAWPLFLQINCISSRPMGQMGKFE